MAFRLPTRVTIASGAFRLLADEVRTVGAQRVLLVLDQGLRATPWPAEAIKLLETAGVSVVVQDQVEPNPRHHTIDAMAAEARQAGVEIVVGLGGGSVLDAAKAVSMLLKNPGSCLDYEGKNRFSNTTVPFLALPTTCGTGSEVTWVSVISHEKEQRKLSVKGDAMFPDVALVDPDLLQTLPAHLVAYTGMDALTHAIEAYTGTLQNPVSDALAEKAIALIFAYLPRLVNDVTDAEARFAVMRASTLAGMAFGNADVGGVHCLSETLGGIWDIPHGMANAMLLAPVMQYHAPFIESRLAAMHDVIAPAATLSPGEGARAFLEEIERLTTLVQIPPFATLGIAEALYPEIAAGAAVNNSNNSNPQPMVADNYLEILKRLPAKA